MGILAEQALGDWWEEVGDWRDVAACRGVPVEVFFPAVGGRYRRAKRLCDRCTVRGECRRFADEVEEDLSPSEVFGLFGGETPDERILRRSGRGGVA